MFNELILNGDEAFVFHGRNRRPPLDCVNAMLSFSYALLARNCSAALESVGLDPYVGFVHTDRPGRESLALDLMEELRPAFADRFVLSCINNRVVSAKMFDKTDSGAVVLNEGGRRAFLKAWQERKKEVLTHPFLKEKLPWGLVPFVQALLLARFLRGDLDAYPPFFVEVRICMLVFITYDVNTENAAGRRRLRKVASGLRQLWPAGTEQRF